MAMLKHGIVIAIMRQNKIPDNVDNRHHANKIDESLYDRICLLLANRGDRSQ